MQNPAYTVRIAREGGFTLLEILMVITLVGIMSVGGISLLKNSTDENRYDATVQAMQNLRVALVGDTNAIRGGARTSFGYLGDMGALPTTAQGLAALSAAPAGSSAWAVDNAVRFGHGWNGPYISAGLNGKNPLQDAWGRNFTYSNSGGVATITSLGADGVAGGTGLNQDIVITISAAEQTGRAYGFLSSGGGPYTGAAEVELASANGSGGLSTTIAAVTSGSQGQFTFNGVPFGPRSVKVYQPSKAAPTATLGPIAFTQDKPSVLISTNLTDFNPANSGGGSGGGGGGGGGIPNGGECAANSWGIINLGTGTSQGSHINLLLLGLFPKTITAIKVDTGGGHPLTTVDFGDGNYSCNGGGKNLTPCPTADNQAASLSPNKSIGLSIINLRLDFSGGNVNNVSVVTVDFTYTSGCDKVKVSNLQ